MSNPVTTPTPIAVPLEALFSAAGTLDEAVGDIGCDDGEETEVDDEEMFRALKRSGNCTASVLPSLQHFLSVPQHHFVPDSPSHGVNREPQLLIGSLVSLHTSKQFPLFMSLSVQ